MKKLNLIFAAVLTLTLCLGIWGFGLGSLSAQGVAINITGNAANSKALLDVDAATMNPKAGLLVPRMTTAERTAITAPIPESLLIYNTTTQCFEAWNNTTATWVAFGCIGCTPPTAVSAVAAPNPICVGSMLNLTGGATNATGWNWTGPNSFTSIVQNPSIASITTAGAGVYTLQASNNCGSAFASTASVSVSATNTAGSASSTPTLCINTALTNITIATTGATGILNDGVSGANGLPAGVSAHWVANVITISGTPTALGTFNYSIPLTGGCGSVNATGTITVTPNNTVTLTSAVGTNAQTVAINTAITNITYSTTGATGATVTGLPTGVTGSWAANVVTISGTPTTAMGSPFSYTVTLTGGCGTVIATGTITVSTCGGTLAINHVIGVVAPETKSVNYGTVSSTLGGTGAKCWITQNLGATNQAASATDATEASAGWYWQFNHKQGFKHDGTTRTPATVWIAPISENSDWVAAQDPCTIELGAGWRIPTYTELFNADATGVWSDYPDPYASVLKIHAAGSLFQNDGSLSYRGINGFYWCSTQYSGPGAASFLYFYSFYCSMYFNNKASGFSVRCLRD